MKRFISDEKRDKWTKNFRLLALILVCMLLLWTLFSSQITTIWQAAMAIVIPGIVGLFISYLVEPLVNILTDRFKMKRAISVGLVVTVLLVAIGVGGFFLVKILIEQTSYFIKDDLPKIVEWFDDFLISKDLFWIKDKIGGDDSQDMIVDFINNHSMDVLTFAGKLFGTITGLLMNSLLVIIFLIYFLHDRSNVFKGVITVLPEKMQKHLRIVGPRSNEIIRAYFRGKFISIAFLAVVFGIIFWALGLGKYAIIFALLLAILDFIPIIGPFIGTAVPMIYTLVTGDGVFGQATCIAVLIADLVAQTLQERIVTPYIIGKQMKINSLLLLCAMLFFSELLGVAGIILSIPICGVIKVLYEYMRETLYPKDDDSNDEDNPYEEVLQIPEEVL